MSIAYRMRAISKLPEEESDEEDPRGATRCHFGDISCESTRGPRSAHVVENKLHHILETQSGITSRLRSSRINNQIHTHKSGKDSILSQLTFQCIKSSTVCLPCLDRDERSLRRFGYGAVRPGCQSRNLHSRREKKDVETGRRVARRREVESDEDLLDGFGT